MYWRIQKNFVELHFKGHTRENFQKSQEGQVEIYNVKMLNLETARGLLTTLWACKSFVLDGDVLLALLPVVAPIIHGVACEGASSASGHAAED